MTDNPQRFDGLEADWLAVDGAGHVAFFTAAGHGPVPAAVGDAARHRDAIASVRSLPATSSIRLVPLFPLDEGTDWQEMARRGIYAFDADHDGYHLRAAPDQPAPVSSLPPAVAQVARSVACRHLTFSGKMVVSFREVRAEAGVEVRSAGSARAVHAQIDGVDHGVIDGEMILARVSDGAREINLTSVDGPILCVLLSGSDAFLMFLQAAEDAGSSSRNPGAREGEVAFLLANGQMDRFPAAWTVTRGDALRAIAHFVGHSTRAEWIAWHEE
jgi:hypothetical protein